MTTQTDPDRDFESLSDKALADFVNHAAPLAANLGDDYASARDQIEANVEAAVAEMKARNDKTPATDGGEVTVESILDDADVDDHYLRHVAPQDYTFKIRHDGHIETDVEDGVIVHRVTEQFSDDAHGDSLSFKNATYKCPIHPDETESSEDHSDHIITTRFTCNEDGCPFETVAGRKAGEEYGTPDYKRPLFFRAAVPHEEDDDMNDRFDKLNVDDVDVEDAANIARKWALSGFTSQVRDAAYVSAEYDRNDDGTLGDKTTDAYIDTFECERCGDEVDAGAEQSHPHFGTVCPDCEDATVWSEDDADLPADVEDRMNDHATFSRQNISALLRDVQFFPNYVAARANDGDTGMFEVDDEDVDPEDVGPIKTGSQGKRNMGDGDYKAGTGLRRSRDGVFNGMTHWRTLLNDAVDTGLIRRADDRDCDDEDPNAAWEVTHKGRNVYHELARCPTCGSEKKPYHTHSHYQAGRRHEESHSLTLRCPTCEAGRRGGKGDSTQAADKEMPGVDYDDA